MPVTDEQSGPVFLSDEGLPNEPREMAGCADCRALKKQWRQATDQRCPAYDMSHAADLAIEICRHPHPKKATR